MWKTVMVSVASVVLTLLVIVGVAWAADIFTVDKDGTVRLVITDTGNVGIGTPGPRARLHTVKDSLYNTATTEALLVSNQTTPAKQIRIGYDSSIDGGYLQSVETSVGYRRLLLNPNGGNVGIGTADPKTKLHVTGLPEYADNAAAIAGGLTAGAFYRTGDLLKVVH